ncbi:Uncharacterized protein FWK35_00030350 [Aphis craccivora]|uniref:Nucleic-acid-binding protein n=1 Tax=Aphis craccivora TaxID=307492 RepID=A0A6G0YA72_APHCR|nr:Uncharacterized protein FWK35_00030350 [Aphis craccivora]
MKSVNNNKRKHSSSSASETPTSPKSQQMDQKIKKKYLLLKIDTKLLSRNENQNQDINPPTNVPTSNTEQIDIDEMLPIKPSPPVFVKSIMNFSELYIELLAIIGVDNYICKSSANKLKILTPNPESYRTLVRYLKEEKAEYHTYQLREDKPLRIVIGT